MNRSRLKQCVGMLQHSIRSSIFIVLFLKATSSLPTPGVCPVLKCTGNNNVLAFQPQTTYIYNLDINTETVVADSTLPPGNNGKMQLTARVAVAAVSACQLAVSLKDVQITGSNSKKYSNLDSTWGGKPVLIGIQNGRLEPELCVDDQDTTQNINLKRAVSSLLQVAAVSGPQTDVFGNCSVVASSSKGGEGITMYETQRDLNRCRGREHLISDIPTETYSFNSDTQAIPLLVASVKTQQRVKNGILEASTSREEYKHQVVKRSAEVTVIVSTSLKLLQQSKRVNFKASPTTTMKSVVFEPPHFVGIESCEKMKTILKDITNKQYDLKVDSEFLSVTRQLVRLLRQTAQKNLNTCYLELRVLFKSNKYLKKIFTDALIFTGTGDSVSLLAELIKKQEIEEKSLFYYRLAFTRHATLQSIQAVTSLLQKDTTPELVLGAGSLAGSYLSQHGYILEPQIKTLLSEIAKPLQNCNPKSHEQENKILVAMKGIHNAHYIPDEIAAKLKECATNKKLSSRVRSAALDSMQGDAGNKNLIETAYKILGDIEEDAELRIKAYLVLATCSCENFANFINNLLANEPVNQVGSYIVSHIRNLRASKNPEKYGAKKYLAAINLPVNKFPIDIRKFSSNSEFSYVIGDGNAAQSTESNVIFSQKSFLPRSASLNLTTHFFGHGFNLFEVGLRQENLEHILESYFGPKGYFKTHSPQEMYEEGNATAHSLTSKIKEKGSELFRSRRSANSGFEKIDAKVTIPKDTNNINLDFYLKLFGAEVSFHPYYNNANIGDPKAAVDTLFNNIAKVIKEAKDFNYKLAQNLLFDAELIYPTAAGFPLRLSASSTAAVNLQFGGKFDINEIIQNPRNAKLKLSLYPSAAVDVASNIELDFFTVRSGVKIATDIHTSTGADVNFEILNGKGFELNVDTPFQKIEIVHAKSQIYATSATQGVEDKDIPIPQDGISQRPHTHMCFDQLSNLTGLNYCYKFNIPFTRTADAKTPNLAPKSSLASYFKSSEFWLYLQTANTLAPGEKSGYKLRAFYNDEEPNKRSFQLLYNFNSKPPRFVEFSVDAHLKPYFNLNWQLQSSFSLGSSGQIINNENEHSLRADIKFLEYVFEAKLGVQVRQKSDTVTTYVPQLIYTLGDATDQSQQQITVDGIITKEENLDQLKFEYRSVRFVYFDKSYVLDGFVLHNDATNKLDLKLQYDTSKSAVLKFDVTKRENLFHSYLECQISEYPDFAFAINYDLKNEQHLVDSKLKIHHGVNLKDEENCITLNYYYKAIHNAEDREIISKCLVSYPALEIYSQCNIELTKRSIHYKLESSVSAKTLSSELTYKQSSPVGSNGDNPDKDRGFELSFKGKANDKSFEINCGRQTITAVTSKVHFEVKLLPSNSFLRINSDVTHQLQKNDLKLKITSVIAVSGQTDIYTLGTGVLYNLQSCESHIKISKGDEDIFLVEGNISHGDDPVNGKFSIVVKNALEGFGTYYHSKSNIDSNLKVGLLMSKLDRKVEINGSVKRGTKVTTKLFNFEILLDANKDPNKKIVVESSVDIAKDGRIYDTKSSLTFNSQKYLLALKGVTASRIPTNAGVLMSIESQLELPSKQKISIFSDHIQLQPKDGYGFQSHFKFNNGKGVKLNYEGKYAKVATFVPAIYDISGKINVEAEKKDVTISYNIINKNENDIQSTEYKVDATGSDFSPSNCVTNQQVDATGSALPEQIHSTLSVELQNRSRYHLIASYGEKLSADVTASLSLLDEINNFAELTLDAKTNINSYESVSYAGKYYSHAESKNYKINAEQNLKINNIRKYDAKYDLTINTEEDNKVSFEDNFEVYFESDETDPTLKFSHALDYTGPGIWKSSLDTPQSLHLSSSIQKFSLSVTAKQKGDGTSSGILNLEGRSPIEGYETITISLDHKTDKAGKKFETKVEHHLGKNIFHSLSEIDLSEQRRSFGINLQRVEPKRDHPIIKILVVCTKATATNLEGEIHFAIGEIKPYSVDVSGTVKYPDGLDDFEISANVNSKSFDLENVVVEISNKPSSKNGRRINVSAKSANKSYLQGSTTYQKKESVNTVTYEGQGNIQFGDESRSSSFRLVNKKLTKDKDSVTGSDIQLNAGVTGSKGKITFEANYILTDKTLRVFQKYCNEENKCAQGEISNSLKSIENSKLHIENKIALDIYNFAQIQPFQFNGKLYLDKLEYEHRIAAEIGSNNQVTKYSYEAFYKNNKGGVYLTLPKRTIALDAVLIRSDNTNNNQARSPNSRSFKLEITCALDKIRKPDQKLTLRIGSDSKPVNNGQQCDSYIKLALPKFPKEFVISSKTLHGSAPQLLDNTISFDIFSNKNNAIIISLKNTRSAVNEGHNTTSVFTIYSEGQNIDVKLLSYVAATKFVNEFGAVATTKNAKLGRLESGIQFSLTPEKLLFLIYLGKNQILEVNGECNKNKDVVTLVKVDISVLNIIVVNTEFIPNKQFAIQTFNKNEPTEKLVYKGVLEQDKELLLSGNLVRVSDTTNLFLLRVALDSAHFLQVDQTINSEQVKESFNLLQKGGKAVGDKLTALVAEISKDTVALSKAAEESFKKAKPNLRPFVQYVQDEYEALSSEIKDDVQVQEIIDLVKNLVSSAAQLTGKWTEMVAKFVNDLSDQISNLLAKLSDFASKLSPVLFEGCSKISRSLVSVLTKVVEIFGEINIMILKHLNEIFKEVQHIISPLVSDFTEEYGLYIKNFLLEARYDVNEFVKLVVEQITTMPIISAFKDRYSEIVETFESRFKDVFLEFVEALKDLPLTFISEDVYNILQDVGKYIEKKVNKVPVNDFEELQKIWRKIQQSSYSVPVPSETAVLELTKQITENELGAPQPVKFSLFDLLFSGSLPSTADILATYFLPRHLDDFFPPHRAYAQISKSQHFLTFDGDQYKLNGNCQYLLARDFGNGNFTLTVELAGGKIKSITLIDHEDSVKLKADHSVELNKKPVELPVHHNGLAIFRTLHKVYIKSRYGIIISCDLDHDLYSFSINGYYFGKTRGLLGTISNEKYDDKTLPNGKIASTVQQFANGYKLSDSCASLTPTEHNHINHKECTQAFTGSTTMRVCFPFVDPTPYRQACDDALDEANGNTNAIYNAICESSAAYIDKCRHATFLHPSLPSQCSQCTIGEEKLSVGASASVKSPQGKADVVILVEQIAENEETYNNILEPLILSLSKNLKSKGITDKQFAIIGYGGPGQQWPALFTNNANFSSDYTKRPAQLTFGAKDGSTNKVQNHPILTFLNHLRDTSLVELAQSKLGQAFEQVVFYPFRAEAAKSVILVQRSPCKDSTVISLQSLTYLFANQFFHDRGISFVFIHPVNIADIPEQKSILGFDDDHVFSFAKKEPIPRSQINFSSDSCASFINLVHPTVITSKNFNEFKVEQRKKFLQAASTRLTTLLSGDETTQSCKCLLYDGLYTQTRCSVTVSKNTGKKGN